MTAVLTDVVPEWVPLIGPQSFLTFLSQSHIAYEIGLLVHNYGRFYSHNAVMHYERNLPDLWSANGHSDDMSMI